MDKWEKLVDIPIQNDAANAFVNIFFRLRLRNSFPKAFLTQFFIRISTTFSLTYDSSLHVGTPRTHRWPWMLAARAAINYSQPWYSSDRRRLMWRFREAEGRCIRVQAFVKMVTVRTFSAAVVEAITIIARLTLSVDVQRAKNCDGRCTQTELDWIHMHPIPYAYLFAK